MTEMRTLPAVARRAGRHRLAEKSDWRGGRLRRAQWTALTRYREDGTLAIDNNVSERALRTVVTGRNNWTFCGSDAGGRRAAILYSFVATCNAHGIDPWAYRPICATCSTDFPPTQSSPR